MEIPFVGGAYEDRSKNLDSQRCQNLFPVVDQEGGKSVLSLMHIPGLSPLVNFGGGNNYLVSLSGSFSMDGLAEPTSEDTWNYHVMDLIPGVTAWAIRGTARGSPVISLREESPDGILTQKANIAVDYTQGRMGVRVFEESGGKTIVCYYGEAVLPSTQNLRVAVFRDGLLISNTVLFSSGFGVPRYLQILDPYFEADATGLIVAGAVFENSSPPYKTIHCRVSHDFGVNWDPSVTIWSPPVGDLKQYYYTRQAWIRKAAYGKLWTIATDASVWGTAGAPTPDIFCLNNSDDDGASWVQIAGPFYLDALVNADFCLDGVTLYVCGGRLGGDLVLFKYAPGWVPISGLPFYNFGNFPSSLGLVAVNGATIVVVRASGAALTIYRSGNAGVTFSQVYTHSGMRAGRIKNSGGTFKITGYDFSDGGFLAYIKSVDDGLNWSVQRLNLPYG